MRTRLVNIGAAAAAEGKFPGERMSKKTWMKAVARGERERKEGVASREQGRKEFHRRLMYSVLHIFFG